MATLVWGISFPLIKVLQFQKSAEVSHSFLSFSLLGMRFLFAAVILVLFQPMLLRGITKAEWKQAMYLAGTAGPGLWLQANGLVDVDASVSAFLTQFYCVLLPLWVCFRSKAWPAGRLVIATLLVLAGVGRLSGFSLDKLHLEWGVAQTLLATFFFTMQILVLEREEFRENRAMTVSLLMFALLGVMGLTACLPLMQAGVNDWADAWGHPICWVMLAVVTLGCTLFSFLAMNKWQPHVTPVEAGLIYCIEPVSTAVASLFLPAWLSSWCGISYANETLHVGLLIGGGLILLANVVLLAPGPANRSAAGA